MGLDEGVLIVERVDATPNPAIEVRETLPDGTEFKAVWSHLPVSGVAKLVTGHFVDGDESCDYRKARQAFAGSKPIDTP